MDEYERKFKAALIEMDNAGIKGFSAYPISVRVFRKLGFKPRPPRYNLWITNMLLTGSYFALTWGLYMWSIIWRHDDMAVGRVVLISIFAGCLFSFLFELYHRFSKKNNGLSDWNDL